MAALATITQFQERLGRTLTDSADSDRASALLDDASAAVRAYTGQEFTLVAGDTLRIRPRDGVIRLPQRPVTAVTSVEDVDGNGVVFDWDYGDSVSVTGLLLGYPFDVEPFRNRLPWLDVVYSHGYATIPSDIVAVVCQMAIRAYGVSAETTGMQSESIAGYSYSVGAAAASGGIGMLAAEREVLDRYRIAIGSIRVGMR